MEELNQKLKTGDESLAVQGNSVAITINQYILSDQSLVESSELNAAISEKIRKFSSKLADEVQKAGINNEELTKKLKEPDTFYIARKAAQTSARTSNDHSELLALLLTERIEAESDIIKILENEAINVAEKLTPNQLKIVTLCCILKHVTQQTYLTWKEMNESYNMTLEKTIDAKFSSADLEHINYSGVGDVGPLTTSLVDWIKHKFGLLLSVGIDESEMSELKEKYSELYKEIFTLKDDKLYLRYTIGNIKRTLKDEVEKELITKIENSYNASLKTDEECLKDFEENFYKGSEIISIWKNTSFGQLTLNSVGTIIGITLHKKYSGNVVDINSWLGI